MYTARKAAQMAAFFTRKNGGTINVLKLTKLLYLGDRESIARFGLPITFDYAVSMPQGPVLTRVLDLTQGAGNERDQSQWNEWISDRDMYDVGLHRDFLIEDLDQLSEADIEVMEKVWGDFGQMSHWALRDYTHTHLPEWEDPNGSMIPMDEVHRVGAIIGNDDEAKKLAEEIEAMRQFGASATG